MKVTNSTLGFMYEYVSNTRIESSISNLPSRAVTVDYKVDELPPADIDGDYSMPQINKWQSVNSQRNILINEKIIKVVI